MDNEKELISRFLNGDQNAYVELMSKYERRIYSTCWHFLHHKQDAEDAAQEVLIKVYRKLDLFRDESSFSTWLNRVAVNTCRDMLRKRKRDKMVSLDQPIDTEVGEYRIELPSLETSPEEDMESQELTRFVEEAMGELRTDHRLVLILRIRHSMSYEDISQILSINIGTVKSRMARARRELRKVLDRMGWQLWRG